MHRHACPCGRILYEDVHQCPTCGRPMRGTPVVYETRLECNNCGTRPADWDLLKATDRPGDQCPCCFLDDYDCDGTLIEVVTKTSESS